MVRRDDAGQGRSPASANCLSDDGEQSPDSRRNQKWDEADEFLPQSHAAVPSAAAAIPAGIPPEAGGEMGIDQTIEAMMG